MYRCCNMKKLVKIIVCDVAVIIAAIVITIAGKGKWRAFNEQSDEAVFVPIIMYHSVKEHTGYDGDYAVSPETVENDLKYLKDSGYTSVSVSDIADYVYYNKPLPEKPVVITADDGFYNNYSDLLPIIEKYDMKATVSVRVFQ